MTSLWIEHSILEGLLSLWPSFPNFCFPICIVAFCTRAPSSGDTPSTLPSLPSSLTMSTSPVLTFQHSECYRCFRITFARYSLLYLLQNLSPRYCTLCHHLLPYRSVAAIFILFIFWWWWWWGGVRGTEIFMVSKWLGWVDLDLLYQQCCQ